MKQGIIINHTVLYNDVILFSFMIWLQRIWGWKNSLKKLRIYGDPHTHYQKVHLLFITSHKQYPSLQSCPSSFPASEQEVLSWRPASSHLSAGWRCRECKCQCRMPWCLDVLSICYNICMGFSNLSVCVQLEHNCRAGAETWSILLMQSIQVSSDAVACCIIWTVSWCCTLKLYSCSFYSAKFHDTSDINYYSFREEGILKFMLLGKDEQIHNFYTRNFLWKGKITVLSRL